MVRGGVQIYVNDMRLGAPSDLGRIPRRKQRRRRPRAAVRFRFPQLAVPRGAVPHCLHEAPGGAVLHRRGKRLMLTFFNKTFAHLKRQAVLEYVQISAALQKAN